MTLDILSAWQLNLILTRRARSQGLQQIQTTKAISLYWLVHSAAYIKRRVAKLGQCAAALTTVVQIPSAPPLRRFPLRVSSYLLVSSPGHSAWPLGGNPPKPSPPKPFPNHAPKFPGQREGGFFHQWPIPTMLQTFPE